MSIRWIRNVVVNGEDKTIEIQLGYHRMGDRCYYRVGDGEEVYFLPPNDQRDTIVFAGLEGLQNALFDYTLTYPDGRLYDWK